MKKIISAVLAVTLCLGAVASCDKKDDKNSGGALSTSGKSKYTSILPLDGSRNLLIESIDSGIKYSINRAKAYEKENKSDKYNPWVIEFSGNKFVMPNNIGDRSYYDGTFSVKNGVIKFSYEGAIMFSHENIDYEKISVNDKAEYDSEIAAGTSEKLNGLSEEEKKEMRQKEQEKMSISFNVEQMQQLNKTGAYCKYTVPLMSVSDKWNDFALLPFIRYIKSGNGKINTELPNTLKTVDDFLCTDTYGVKLKGSYKKGKDFKLEYNFIDTLTKDEQSPYKENDNQYEWLEHMTEIAENQYNCDSLKSTIKFSGGEWEWCNADDDLLNNGKYEESKKYPGLIKMYVDEDSEKCPEYAKNTPLWFYIDDGKIYYPAFVKVD